MQSSREDGCGQEEVKLQEETRDETDRRTGLLGGRASRGRVVKASGAARSSAGAVPRGLAGGAPLGWPRRVLRGSCPSSLLGDQATEGKGLQVELEAETRTNRVAPKLSRAEHREQ